MSVDNGIRYGNELAVRAVATFYSGFTTYTWLPFVGAGGRIARLSAVFTFPAQSPYIIPPRNSRRNSATLSSVDKVDNFAPEPAA
ncbi:hypothetical protein DR88_5213 [Klebsiella pneumoniae]|nr:hypothetical protein DR88_5213 [Klebsiella pneumoniae]